MELLSKLGIDWRLLIAQLVNFVILLAVLYKFLYKPVLKLLNERSTKIEQGIKNADEVQIKLKEATATYDKKLSEARGEAQKMLESARKEAEGMKTELVTQAHAEAEKIIASGKSRLEAERERIMREAEAELTDLVADATQHVLGQVVTPEIDKKLIEESVRKAKIGRA